MRASWTRRWACATAPCRSTRQARPSLDTSRHLTVRRPPPESGSARGAGSSAKRFLLNSGDGVHARIRDWHIGAVAPWLNNQAKELREGYRNSKVGGRAQTGQLLPALPARRLRGVPAVSQEADLKELHEFVAQAKSLPLVQTHIDLFEAQHKVSSRPAFTERVRVEQALLDLGPGEPACAFAEVAPHRGCAAASRPGCERPLTPAPAAGHDVQ